MRGMAVNCHEQSVRGSLRMVLNKVQKTISLGTISK